jgi:HTTM domain
MSGLLRRWNAFWFAQGSPTALGVFRAAFAACLLLEVRTSAAMNVFALRGGFHLPYPISPPLVSRGVYDALHVVQLPLVVALGLGLYGRVAAAGLLALQGWLFFADQLNFRNHPYLFLLVLGLLALSPADAGFSVRAAWRRRRGAPPAPAPLTIRRLLQVQVSLVYLFAGLHKLNPGFLGGHVLAQQLSTNLGAGLSGWLLHALVTGATLEAWRAALAVPANLVAVSWASAGLELGLAVALWPRRTRALAAAAGAAFHLGIGLAMDVLAFSLAMLASYALFLLPDREDAPDGPAPPAPRAPAVTRPGPRYSM